MAEDAGTVLIGVLRDENSAATVDFATTDVTATNELDYAATNGTLSFAPGEKLKRIAVPILNDGVKEAIKTFQVTLSGPMGGAVLGTRTNTTVSIRDNDAGVGFELTSQSVWEKAGAVTLPVLRGNDGNLGPFTVDYATSDLTAKAGEDYQAVAGTLEFRENEVKASRSSSPDAVAGAERFEILSQPTGGVTLGTPTAVTIVRTTRRWRHRSIPTWRSGGTVA